MQDKEKESKAVSVRVFSFKLGSALNQCPLLQSLNLKVKLKFKN